MNLLKIFLHKEWFVMKLIKIKWNWLFLMKLQKLIKTIKKNDNSKVKVGPTESMSKSKKYYRS